MQKPLKKGGKKVVQGGKRSVTANKHGKGGTATKKGRLAKGPKKAGLKKAYDETQSLTRMINEENETNFAGIAKNSGGKLALLKAPVISSAHEQHAKKKRKSQVWGASSKG
eukprot:jgi/Picsp_1/5130/NSC_02493-R1_---NA---